MRCSFSHAAAHEALAHQQVARKVTHQRQFRRHHQVRAVSLRPSGIANDQRGIPVEVPRRGVNLKKR